MASGEHHIKVRDLLGPYALEAVEVAERREVEDHLQHCDVCRNELADLRKAVRLLPERPEPSDVLWKRIVAQVHGEESGSGLG